jgi:CRISPR-associated protein Cmr5
MRINQNKVEKAIQVITGLGLKELPREMKGDIASYGAGIIQSGLLPATLFFSEGNLEDALEKLKKAEKDEDANTKARRAVVMNLIFEVMETGQNNGSKQRPLLDYVRHHRDCIDQITEAALAVKIAMRAFKFTEK